MCYYALAFVTSRRSLSLHALVRMAVGVLLLMWLSQVAPALANGASGVVYVANFVSNDVWVYTIQANGELQLQGSVGAGQGPRSITVSPDGRFAYVTNVNSHEITLYDIDSLGNLTKRPTSGRIISPTIFDPARAMAIHPTSRRLYLPEYLTAGCLPICAPSNSWLSIYELDAEGYLGSKTTVESGQIPRAVAVTHSGRNVYVATQGTSRVCIYQTDETTGVVTAIPGCLSTGGSYPEAVKVDPTDTYTYVVNSGGGNERGSLTAFRITPTGLLSPITTVPAGLFPLEIAFNPSGTFAAVVDHDGNAMFLYRIASTGEPLPQGSVPTGTHPFSVAFDPSGRFAYVANFVDNTLSRFALDTTTGQMTLQGTVPTGSGPAAVAVFALQNTAAPSGLAAAVLPSSRSVQVGGPATAFATIINVGSGTATGCSLSPIPSLPATFTFQTTHPATNQVTGTPNSPVNIGAGAAQSFVFALTPMAPIDPTDVQMSFDCANADPAPITSGLNTLLFSASADRKPDMVALAATLTNDGIVNIPGITGTGVFAVATVNVGATGAITVSADTGGATPAVTVSLCQTNSATGLCISSIGSSVSTQIDANATPTFGIFVTGTGMVSFDPATNRIFVRFKDAGGVTRGSTSVAVRTMQ